MDDHFTISSCPTAKAKGETEQLTGTGDGRVFSYQKFSQKSTWKAGSGSGTRSGRTGGTKSSRTNGKPPRPPRPSSVVCGKIQKPQSHVTQCEIVLRRGKFEGKRVTVKEKTNASAVVLNALAALLVTICFLLLTIGPGVLPKKFLTYAQIKTLPQLIQIKLLINGSAEYKMESQQSQNSNLRSLDGYPLLDLFTSNGGKPDKHNPRGGPQMKMAGIEPVRRALSAGNRKVRLIKNKY